MTQWQNRITESGTADPEELLANPFNFRVHPKHQQDSLSAVLDSVGWVGRVIVNRTTGHVVDGHLRVSLALSRNEKEVPVDYVELSENEEKQVLATFDAITNMATIDKDVMKALYEGMNADTADMQELLSRLASGIVVPDMSSDFDAYGVSTGGFDGSSSSSDYNPTDSPTDFKSYDEDVETEYCCPKCSYQWSGRPK